MNSEEKAGCPLVFYYNKSWFGSKLNTKMAAPLVPELTSDHWMLGQWTRKVLFYVCSVNIFF